MELDQLKKELKEYEDLNKSDSPYDRAIKIIALIQEDYEGFNSLNNESHTIKEEYRELIIKQEEDYQSDDKNIIRKVNKYFDTSTIVAISIARNILNPNKIYKD